MVENAQSALWTDKYAPKAWAEFVGNGPAVKEVQAWASSWEKGKKQPPLLLHGGPGNGKTSLALLTARMMDWSVFELNASDFRTKDVIERLAGAASQGASFSGQKRLVLLDEVDGLQRRDTGGAGAILKILKTASNPVLLTANDAYSQKIRSLRAAVKTVALKKVNYLSMAKRLREILTQEGVKFGHDAVEELARNAEGDFRAALLDAQTLALHGEVDKKAVERLSTRQREEDIFTVLKHVFRPKSILETRRKVFDAGVEPDLLTRWVEENIPRQLEDEGVGDAFDWFSRGDVFEGRIRKRQYWGFRRYSSVLMSSGVGLSHEHLKSGWVPYQFPTIMSKLSASKSARALRTAAAKKIGKQVHSSTKQVIQYELPLLQALCKDKENAARFCAQFNLDADEAAFLMQTKPSTKKVQKAVEGGRELRQKAIAVVAGTTGRTSTQSVKAAKKKEEKRAPVKKSGKKAKGGKQTTLFG